MLASASWPVTNYAYGLNKWLNKAQPGQSQWPREIQHRSPCWIGPVRSLCVRERVSICVTVALLSGLASLHTDTQAGLLADHCGSWPQADSMSRRAHTQTHKEAVTEALLFRHSHSFSPSLSRFLRPLPLDSHAACHYRQMSAPQRDSD